jgi:cytochrome c biogenesis protein CcdA
MSLQNNGKQKSLKRRFLLILGATTFVFILALGLMIMFWSQMPLQLTKWQRIAFGSLVIIYAVLRFARLFKKDPDEE